MEGTWRGRLWGWMDSPASAQKPPNPTVCGHRADEHWRDQTGTEATGRSVTAGGGRDPVGGWVGSSSRARALHGFPPQTQSLPSPGRRQRRWVTISYRSRNGEPVNLGKGLHADRIVTPSGLTPNSLLSFDISEGAGILRKFPANLSWAFGLGILDSPCGRWEVAGREKSVEKWRGGGQNP